MPTDTRLETYYARRAAAGGAPVPELYHVSFNIRGRVVSDKVRGYPAAVARLDLLVEVAEAEEQENGGRIVLATNCKVRKVEEISGFVRAHMAMARAYGKASNP